MRRSTKILFVRRTVFVLLILAVHILQNTRGLFPEIFGVKANPLIPLVICIGMFEREIAGAVLGMLAGILWDSVSPMGDGYNALLLMLAGAAAGLLIDYLMRNNLMTALLLSGFACLIYSVFYVVFSCSQTELTARATCLYATIYLRRCIHSFHAAVVHYSSCRYAADKNQRS